MKTLKKIAYSIPLSCILIAAGSVAVGVCYDWHLGAAVTAMALWPVAPALMVGPFCDAPRFIGDYRPITLTGEFTPENFSSLISELRNRINSMMAGLPPLEQFEAASDLSYGLRALQNSAANLITLAGSLEDAVKQYGAKQASQAEANAETALLAKGEYIKKTDSEAAVKAAAELKEKEVKDAQDAENKAKVHVTSARAKLVEDKVCTEATAAALPSEFFKEEGYLDRVTKLTARLKTLADNKLNTADFVAEMAALPMDEAGEKLFQARVKSVKGLVASTAGRSGGGGETNPLAVGAGAETDAVPMIF